MPREDETNQTAVTPASSPPTQLEALLAQLYREFGFAASADAPLTGVSLALTYVGREPVVASMGHSDIPHAHGLETAAAHVRMVLRKTADPRVAALLEKAARILAAAEHLKRGTFFETNVKH